MSWLHSITISTLECARGPDAGNAATVIGSRRFIVACVEFQVPSIDLL